MRRASSSRSGRRVATHPLSGTGGHMNLVERDGLRRMTGCFLGALLLATLVPSAALAQAPIASSNFVGFEDPLSENGAWTAMTSMAPNGTRFQKNNMALPNGAIGPGNNHAGARTTAAVPTDHYSEIVVGHVGLTNPGQIGPYVGPLVRVQTSGASIDSDYMWWGTQGNGDNNLFYRVDANGTTYNAVKLIPHPPFNDGDRLRLIARGPVIYGNRNGVSEFIYNTGANPIRYPTGTAGMLAFVPVGRPLTDATITSWSTGPAPVSSGTWASSTFAGTENPLDEGDRWYPLAGAPGANGAPYSGFKKLGGLAIGLDTGHNAAGVWSIAPPARQYSEVTLGTAASGGGGPIVRIDRTNAEQTGWLLFLFADSPGGSGIYKLTNGNFTLAPACGFTPAIVPGDKWRLTADGNTLTASRNGVAQLTCTTDGSYPAGDVGIHAYTTAFTFSAWEGGDTAGASTGPTITSFAPTSGSVGTSVTINGTNFTGATAVAFNGVSASFTVSSATAIQATVPAGTTTGPLSVTTAAGTATSTSSFTVVSPPTIASFAPTSGAVGISVTINGTNFTGASAVAINGVSATFTVSSATAIQATVPAGATTGPLSVTTPGGSAPSSSSVPVVSPPTIASFAPTSGVVGTSVTINGTNFTGTSAVAFNAVSATFTVSSATAIQATVPAGATTGRVSVTTSAGTATSTSNFTIRVALNANKAGTGSGTVTSTSNPASPTQIDCGATCSVSYDSGTVVTLTATPAAGSTHSGWIGCDTVSGPTCTVTMSGARSVTASFSLQTFTLSVRKTRLLTGNGTVTSTSSPANPNQINCGG